MRTLMMWALALGLLTSAAAYAADCCCTPACCKDNNCNMPCCK